MLALQLKRFELLYPRLVKKAIENKGLREQAISKDDLKEKVNQELQRREHDNVASFEEEAKIVSSMAKVEILTVLDQAIGGDQQLSQTQSTEIQLQKQELLQKIQEINQYQCDSIQLQKPMPPAHIFTIFMLAQFSKKMPSESQNLFHLYKMMQANTLKYINFHIQQQRAQNEYQMATDQDSINEQQQEFNFNGIESIDTDRVVNQSLMVIGYLQKLMIKSGSVAMVKMFLDDFVVSCNELINQFGIEQHLNQIDQNTKPPNLRQMLPFAFVFKILMSLLNSKHFNEQILTKKADINGVAQQLDIQLIQQIQDIYRISQMLTTLFKNQSRLFLSNHAADSSWKKQRAGNKETKRAEGLFTQIQDVLIQFNCTYFQNFVKIIDESTILSQYESLFMTIFVDDQDGVENFLLSERLTILSQLNHVNTLAPKIFEDDKYWNFIRRGIYDYDAYCRKLAQNILQSNLKMFQNMPQFKEKNMQIYQTLSIDQQQFESLWTSFFDIYDTLDSFNSHLTKAIWDRTEIFYEFLSRHQQVYITQSKQIHPLADFVQWLQCLSMRALTHENHNIRKYVQKAILQRKYMTPLTSSFLLKDMLENLNIGIILKDSNAYTQFSKNNILIIDFYSNYFNNESIQLDQDMKILLNTTVLKVNNPQLIVSIFKVFAKNYQREGRFIKGFIGADELLQVAKYLRRFEQELIFSNRYLCCKYILQMLSLYLKMDDLISKGSNQSSLLVLLGQMPFEFFSASDSIIYTDREGLETASFLVDRFGRENFQSIICSYLNDIFQVKASLNAIPKFQGVGSISGILKGIVRALLILDTKYEDDNVAWFQQAMQDNLQVFLGQVLSSSYISSDIIEQKIECFTVIYADLLAYSSTQKFRDLLVYHVKMSAHLIIDRIEHNLLAPLSLYASNDGDISGGPARIVHGYQDRSKMQASFKALPVYAKYSQVVVRCFHIYQSFSGFDQNQASSDSVVEKLVKLLLSQALKLSQLTLDPITQKPQNIFNNENNNSNTSNLGVFLWQHCVFEMVFSMLHAYSQGIKENMKRGIDNLLIPDAVFSIGKSLSMNLVHFENVKYNHRVSGDQRKALTADQYEFLDSILIDREWTTKLMQVQVNVATWSIIGELITLLAFDEQLRNEMVTVLYPELSKKAIEHLHDNMESDISANTSGSNWSKVEGTMNRVIFSIIKQAYIPLFIQKLQSPQVQPDDKKATIEEMQKITQKSWDTLKTLKGIFELQALQEFLELTFRPEIMELYMALNNQQVINNEVVNFHVSLAREIFEFGNHVWLILRSTFNHLMFIFSQKPYLLTNGFQKLLVDFSTCREIRSLDSDIHLYRLETLLPLAVPKKYEKFSLEQISYQGAYIRCLTLMMSEGMISNVLTQINCCSQEDAIQSQPIQQSLNALEGCIVNLLRINQKLEKLSQSEMPYSQQHREKLRTWQSLIVFLQLLDPQIYTKEFRMARQQISGVDIIGSINEFLWHSIKQSHVPSVRQYIEVFTVKFSLAFPEDTIGQPFFISTLLDPNVKPQVNSSFIMIAGYCMLHTQTLNDSQTTHFKKTIFEALLGFCTSNSAHTRSMAQFFVRELYRTDAIFRPFIVSGSELLLNFFDKCKNTRKILDKYGVEVKLFTNLIEQAGFEALMTTKIDEYGEFVHKPFADILREITSEIITQIRNENHYLGDKDTYWRKLLQESMEKGELNVQVAGLAQGTDFKNEGGSDNIDQSLVIESHAQNYQKKMLPWDQVELEKNQIKRQMEKRKRNDVIICASLIDKVPNLAGLTRTCEIMNAKALVINSKDVVKTDEFAQIAVTAQKWQPIHEVQVPHLFEYLLYQKSNGYKILGLEQTANSKMLNDYKFPEKCLLLLGKEKEGIPQEYLRILDECIEIPQYGIIRSLNVHVSGALCLWEYTKQMQK